MKRILFSVCISVIALAACGPQDIKNAQNAAMGDTAAVKNLVDSTAKDTATDVVAKATDSVATNVTEKPAKEVKQEVKTEAPKKESTGSTNGRKTVYGKWVLESLDGKAATKQLFPKGIPYINLDGGKHTVVGFGGCNNINGEFEIVQGHTLKIDKLISTKMFCEGVPENELVSLLRGSHDFTTTGDKLMLKDGGAVKAVFYRPYE